MTQSLPSLFFPKEPCILEGRAYLIPILFLSDNETFDAANRWLRSLALKSRSPRTLSNYAWCLLKFLKFLGDPRGLRGQFSWQEISNSTIRMWRNDIELEELKASTATYYVNVLFHFLTWAYENDEFHTPILKKMKRGEAGAIARSEINTKKSETVHSPPPSTKDMVAVQQAIAAYGGDCVERDMLMFRWAKEVGFRSADITGLRAITFFTWGQILEFEQDARPAILLVKGKGEKVRKTHPPISLLKDTRSYLDSLPADEVKAIDRIFYSEDRLPLSQQYVSHRFAHYFKIAGLDSHLHRARAYYLYQVILIKIQELAKTGDLNDFSAQTVLQFTLDAAGHGDIEVLKYYVDLGLMSFHAKVFS